MVGRISIGVCAALFTFLGVAQADTVNARCDIYPKGQDKASASIACTFSQRQGAVTIERADGARHDLRPQGRPGNFLDQDKKLVYRKRALGKAGLIFAMPKETVYVYWDVAGLAPKPADNEQSSKAAMSLLTLPPIAAPLSLDLQLQGIGFKVESANDATGSVVKVTPSGLSIDNSVQESTIGGQIAGADVGDLNNDGSPEIYVFLRRSHTPYSGSLLAYGANNKKSLSQISIDDITQNPAHAAGYRGYDQFAVVEDQLVRRFPVFKPNDSDDKPSSIRQISYKLVAGEASFRLQAVKSDDF